MPNLALYIKRIIPSDYQAIFSFNGDFNKDGKKETVLGFSLPDDYEKNIYVLITNGLKASLLSITEEYYWLTNTYEPLELYFAFVKETDNKKYNELYLLLRNRESSLIPLKVRWKGLKPYIYI